MGLWLLLLCPVNNSLPHPRVFKTFTGVPAYSQPRVSLYHAHIAISYMADQSWSWSTVQSEALTEWHIFFGVQSVKI